MRKLALSWLTCLALIGCLTGVAPVAANDDVGKKVDAEYLSPLEREVVEEIDLARADPQKYAAFVEEFRKFYNGERLMLPGKNAPS